MNDLEFNIWREWVKINLGLNLESDKKYLVEHRLNPLIQHFKLSNLTDLHREVSIGRNSLIKLAVIDAITTHETSWFRDSKPFELFQVEIFPKWISELKNGTRTQISIWSAACSTGQEPYTLAIILADLCKGDPQLISKIKIFASDVSESTLEEAKTGLYSDFAIQRGVELNIKNRWFNKKVAGWDIHDTIKKMVEFKCLNLAHPIYLSNKQDLILCRNVLIYFTPEMRLKILNDLERWMNKDGILILGASENSSGVSPKLTLKRFSSISYFEKKIT